MGESVDLKRHKEKLLEYLERENDALTSQNEAITSRAGITVALLSGIAFVAMQSKSLGTKMITVCAVTISVRCILGVLFFLSIIPLVCMLVMRKRFNELDFFKLKKRLYTDSEHGMPVDAVEFYTEIYYEIFTTNKKAFRSRVYLYNSSLIFFVAFVLVYLCYA